MEHRAPIRGNEGDRSVALDRLEKLIAAGQDKAMRGLAAMEREYNLRSDYVVKPDVIDVEFREIPATMTTERGEKDAERIVVEARPVIDGKALALTPFSKGQFYERAGIPQSFAEKVLGLDRDLLRENVRRLLPKVSKDGVLIREIEGTAKGILSPSYRRMDASPIFQEYAEVSLAAGFVPGDGQVTDTRSFLSFMRPEIVDLGHGEYVVMGHELRTSDYGNGALQLTCSVIRLLCVNGLIGMDVMRKVHLGRRFDQREFASGDVVALSQRTIDLDTATVRSALADTTKFLPAQLDTLQASLTQLISSEKQLSTSAAISQLKSKGVRKELIEKATTLYESELPVESVPAKPGAWRWAQTLALVAKSSSGDERKELEEAAFSLLPLKAA